MLTASGVMAMAFCISGVIGDPWLAALAAAVRYRSAVD
jgi:hypothetical protein